MEETHSPWAITAEQALQALAVQPAAGLAEADVRERRQRYGPNTLRQAGAVSAWEVLARQFRSLVVLLLAAAAALSFAFGEVVQGIAIVIALLINGGIGFVTEIRAVRSVEALKRLGRVYARVRRAGSAGEVPADDLVPGDVVLVEAGDVVSADLRLIQASRLEANESTLTGEALPVSKQVGPLPADTVLPERTNMLFRGTAVTRGAGEGVVVATGMHTELGQISALVEQAGEERTPLEARLDQLGRWLVWVTLAVAALIAVGGILLGRDPFVMVQTAIALAVAAIPEGLPVVATVALARGLQRMARRNALVNRLAAVETLGAANVVLVDKTGTLTENRMTATRLVLAGEAVAIGGLGLDLAGAFSRDGQPVDPRGSPLLLRALEVGVLCNDASLSAGGEGDGGQGVTAVGDPTEVALLVAGAKAGLERARLLERLPEVREVAFDPDLKMMATYHRAGSHLRLAVKGSPDAVLEAAARVATPSGEQPLGERERADWRAQNDRLATAGLRVLALADKVVDRPDAEPYTGLTLLGLIALKDPPRQDVAPALAAAHSAGIAVVMVTGDQPATAESVARAVGLVSGDRAAAIHGRELKPPEQLSAEERAQALAARIFARVSPKQKLDLIAIHQAAGAVVGMTGDGVNDAPALKQADIGIAMGQRGTQVAREAADMVLTDDAFATIVAAIEEGRVIFANIRKFIVYLVSCNASEFLVVGLAALAGAPLPLLPLQILYLNFITDVFPALALGVGKGSPSVMRRPPRPRRQPILTRTSWLAIAGYGLLIAAPVLGAFAATLNRLGGQQPVSVAFLTIALAQLWHVFNMRERGTSLLRNEITANRYVWGAIGLSIILLLPAVYLPPLASVLGLAGPGAVGWALIIAASLIPWAVGQALKRLAPPPP